MSDALDITQSHGQDGLRAVESLNLAFLIYTQYQGVVGRVQVETDDIAHLLDEKRIGRELEAATAMRLQPEGLKQPMHRGFGNPTGLGRLAHAPLGGCGWLAPERPFKQGRNPLIIDAARPTGTQLVIQTRQAVLDEPLSPLTHRGLGPVQTAGNLAVVLSPRRPQHQPRTGHQPMRQSARSGQTAQLSLLDLSQSESRFGAAGHHARQLTPKLLIILVIYGTQH